VKQVKMETFAHGPVGSRAAMPHSPGRGSDQSGDVRRHERACNTACTDDPPAHPARPAGNVRFLAG
jgi:hypothetical protein